jgi:hypothetical protein
MPNKRAAVFGEERRFEVVAGRLYLEPDRLGTGLLFSTFWRFKPF